MKQVCKYCGQVFDTPYFKGTKRTYCYRKECVEEERQRVKEYHKKYHATWQKNKIAKRKYAHKLCTKCHINPVMEGNRFLCKECYEFSNDIIDLYIGYGADHASTTRRKSG